MANYVNHSFLVNLLTIEGVLLHVEWSLKGISAHLFGHDCTRNELQLN
jgi:hypothetical protein